MTLKSLDPSLQILPEQALILHTLHTKNTRPWSSIHDHGHLSDDGNDNGESTTVPE